MSLEQDGKHIRCDGDGCMARTCIPVARGDSAGGDECLQSVRGWLFVLDDNITRHYCPRCSERQLSRLRWRDLQEMG